MTALTKINHHANEFTHQIKQAANTLHLTITDVQVQSLLAYLDGLLLWGKAYNLTAILAPQEALIKHIFDCMAIVPDLPFGQQPQKRLLDIGTGAGLPSVVIAILKPDWQITALDSNQKKIRFIRQIVSELYLANITPVASRIEDFEGFFDVITSRAFASLADFVALATPYLHQQGVLYAMKGKAPTQDELMSVQALGICNWQIKVKPIAVPQLCDDRCVVYLSDKCVMAGQ